MIVVDGVEMLDVREAAATTRRTPETIRRWVWTGRVTSVKRGNRLLVPRAEVEALVAESGDLTPGPTLASWADDVLRPRRAARVATAADLIVDDRAGR